MVFDWKLNDVLIDMTKDSIHLYEKIDDMTFFNLSKIKNIENNFKQKFDQKKKYIILIDLPTLYYHKMAFGGSSGSIVIKVNHIIKNIEYIVKFWSNFDFVEQIFLIGDKKTPKSKYLNENPRTKKKLREKLSLVLDYKKVCDQFKKKKLNLEFLNIEKIKQNEDLLVQIIHFNFAINCIDKGKKSVLANDYTSHKKRVDDLLNSKDKFNNDDNEKGKNTNLLIGKKFKFFNYYELLKEIKIISFATWYANINNSKDDIDDKMQNFAIELLSISEIKEYVEFSIGLNFFFQDNKKFNMKKVGFFSKKFNFLISGLITYNLEFKKEEGEEEKKFEERNSFYKNNVGIDSSKFEIKKYFNDKKIDLKVYKTLYEIKKDKEEELYVKYLFEEVFDDYNEFDISVGKFIKKLDNNNIIIDSVDGDIVSSVLITLSTLIKEKTFFRELKNCEVDVGQQIFYKIFDQIGKIDLKNKIYFTRNCWKRYGNVNTLQSIDFNDLYVKLNLMFLKYLEIDIKFNNNNDNNNKISSTPESPSKKKVDYFDTYGISDWISCNTKNEKETNQQKILTTKNIEYFLKNLITLVPLYNLLLIILVKSDYITPAYFDLDNIFKTFYNNNIEHISNSLIIFNYDKNENKFEVGINYNQLLVLVYYSIIKLAGVKNKINQSLGKLNLNNKQKRKIIFDFLSKNGKQFKIDENVFNRLYCQINFFFEYNCTASIEGKFYEKNGTEYSKLGDINGFNYDTESPSIISNIEIHKKKYKEIFNKIFI